MMCHLLHFSFSFILVEWCAEKPPMNVICQSTAQEIMESVQMISIRGMEVHVQMTKVIATTVPALQSIINVK
jgi:hypothetical protein